MHAPTSTVSPGAAPWPRASPRGQVTLNDLRPEHLSEVAGIPKGRLIYVKLGLDAGTPAAMQQLRRAGFMPATQCGWYGLMQRGYQEHELDLHCPISRALHQDSLRSEAA
ncbi:MAG TPA: hypothetical protein DCW29_15340 [Janthinobacterium sp.]|nr:hypothetical protein [Janthinobacterium sp.]